MFLICGRENGNVKREIIRCAVVAVIFCVFSSCHQVKVKPELNKETSELQALTFRVNSLEDEVRRARNEIVILQLRSYIDNAVSMVMPPEPDCKFAVSNWAQSESTLRSFIEDSAKFRNGNPDPQIKPNVHRLLWAINTNCRSNLVFNP